MAQRLVKVAQNVLNLNDSVQDMQESLFSVSDKPLLKLDQNEATVPPSPLVLKALKRSLDSKSLNHSPDLQSRKLRRKLADYTGVTFDSIACYANLAGAMETACNTYLQPGLNALISRPSDNPFAHYAACAGADLTDINFGDFFEPRIEEIVSSIKPKTRIIYLANPNGITGGSLTEAELVFLLSYAESSMVVVDESYFEFCGMTVANLIPRFPNLIVIRTLSKGFALAGLDVGYLMTDSRNFRFLNRLSYFKGPDALSQVAAEAALKDLHYMGDLVYQVNESKKLLFAELTRLGFNFRISPANFFLLRAADPGELTRLMAANNIFICDLKSVPGFEKYVRITIGSLTQTSILLEFLASDAANRVIKSTADQQWTKSANRINAPLYSAPLTGINSPIETP